jgi:UDP-glucose:(heptosyl)LPS alpha-1,3-glucosyltransferase
MKIAITHSRFTYVGGAEKYIYFLLQRLLAEGHEVHYYCHYREDYHHPNLHFHYVPMIKGIRFLKAIGFALALSHKLRLQDYDIVHGFYKTLKQDIYTDGSGTAVEYQDYVLGQRSGLSKILRRYSLYHYFDRLLENKRFQKGNYRKILCMSGFVKEQIQQAYGVPEKNIMVLYNGIDCDFFHPRNVKSYRPEIRKELGISESDVVYLSVGNDYLRKNVAVSLKAFAQMPSKNKAKLLIVGRDNHEEDYKNLAKDLNIEKDVIFAGPRRDIHKIHSCADVFIFPSHYDVFGMVVLEAMCTAIPVIVSSQAGASELLSDGKDGFILKDWKSPQTLSDRMEILMDKFVRKKMGEEARHRSEDFSWDLHFKRLLDIYQEVAEEKKNDQP